MYSDGGGGGDGGWSGLVRSNTEVLVIGSVLSSECFFVVSFDDMVSSGGANCLYGTCCFELTFSLFFLSGRTWMDGREEHQLHQQHQQIITNTNTHHSIPMDVHCPRLPVFKRTCTFISTTETVDQHDSLSFFHGSLTNTSVYTTNRQVHCHELLRGGEPSSI